MSKSRGVREEERTYHSLLRYQHKQKSNENRPHPPMRSPPIPCLACSIVLWPSMLDYFVLPEALYTSQIVNFFINKNK
jgi:hypothetical protein